MKIQVLVAAMHQTDASLIKKMNIQTDAIIGNQCDICSDVEYNIDGCHVTYYNRKDRGVGLNRNVALLHAGEGILTFADEDMVFVDGYNDIIKNAFDEIPKADAIIFNITTLGTDVGRRYVKKAKRIHFYNALNYGAARISAKGTAIKRENITFHSCFGGGTRYNSGEDTLFITEMLKKKLKIYVYPVCIATVDQTTSTWFSGYNEKYLYDNGVLFAAVSRVWAKALCLQNLIRHKYIYKECNLSLRAAYKIMLQGVKAYKDLIPYTKK